MQEPEDLETEDGDGEGVSSNLVVAVIVRTSAIARCGTSYDLLLNPSRYRLVEPMFDILFIQFSAV